MTNLLKSFFLLAGLSLSLSAQVIQEEPNDSIATATPSTLTAGEVGGMLSVGNNGDGPYGPTTGDSTGDFDFFSVEANAGQVMIFDVNSAIDGTSVDSLIGIYSSSGELVESNDDDGVSRDSFLRYPVPTNGTYYLVVGNWVPGAANDADSLPTNPNTEGTGRGAPGGGIDDYEVAILLDASVYLTYIPPDFPVSDPDEVAEGSFTLTNEGSSTATITALNLSGSGATAFSIDQTLPLTIAAGASSEISVSFAPDGSADPFTGEIEIVSNDLVRPSLSLPLNAKAVNGLLFRLPFDDPAGSPIGQFGSPAETSGNNFDAAMVVNGGAPPPVFGRPPIAGDEGFSTLFNDAGSSGNYVLTPNGFPHIASFTYSLWIRPTAGSGEDTLFNRDPGFGLGDAIYGCTVRESGEVVFRIGGVETVISDVGAVPDDEIRHIVVTHLDTTGFGDFTADRTRLFIDGTMVAENTETFEIPEYNGGTNSRLWIGTRSAAGTGFNGDMDDFQIYNIELDPDDVENLYHTPGSVLGEVPSPPLEITTFSRSPDGNSAQLTFNSRPNKTYILEASRNLSTWIEANDSIESEGLTTSTNFEYGLVFDPASHALFFRIREAP